MSESHEAPPWPVSGRCPIRVARVSPARGPPLPLPGYQHDGDAGMDLCTDVDFCLAPGERRLVPTGLRFEVPPGFELQVRPRSGLAVKHGVTVLNAPGTVDSGFRGEVRVPLINLGQDPYSFARGDRIAQAVIAPFVHATLVEAELAETERGDSGFGSTGE